MAESRGRAWFVPGGRRLAVPTTALLQESFFWWRHNPARRSPQTHTPTSCRDSRVPRPSAAVRTHHDRAHTTTCQAAGGQAARGSLEARGILQPPSGAAPSFFLTDNRNPFHHTPHTTTQAAGLDLGQVFLPPSVLPQWPPCCSLPTSCCRARRPRRPPCSTTITTAMRSSTSTSSSRHCFAVGAAAVGTCHATRWVVVCAAG